MMSQQLALKTSAELDAELFDAVDKVLTQAYHKKLQNVHIQESEGEELITVQLSHEATSFSMFFIKRLEKKLGWEFTMFSVYHSSSRKDYSNITLFFKGPGNILK